MAKEIKEMMSVVFEIMGSDELAKKIAQMSRNIVNKLVEKGFTEEQAIQILIGINFNKK